MPDIGYTKKKEKKKQTQREHPHRNILTRKPQSCKTAKLQNTNQKDKSLTPSNRNTTHNHFSQKPTHIMKDYLLPLSFYPNSTSLFYRNLHEIIGSFLMYSIIYQFLCDPIIKHLIFPRYPHYFSKLKSSQPKTFKEYLNFKIHIVAMVQCILSIILVSKNLFKQPLNLDITEYQDDYSTMVSSVTIGYFLWDLYVCIRWYSLFQLEFLVHALASLAVFVSTLRPFAQSWVSKFLIFELSSPFVNINWFISNILIKVLGVTSVPLWINALNGLMLISTFTVVRIFWGFSAVMILCYNVYAFGMYKNVNFSFSLMAMILIINFLMNCLNVFWLSKMLQIAKKMLMGSSKDGHKKI